MHGSLIEMSLTFQTPSLNASCFAPGLKLANLLLHIKVKIERAFYSSLVDMIYVIPVFR